MSPETLAIADEMCQQFWHVILNDKSQIETGFLKAHDNIGQFARPHILPSGHFNERLKALNAMQAFGVFKLELENEWDTTNPLESFPTGECLYRIIDFDSQKFIEFCSKYGIVLRDNPNVHFAMLEIGKDNIPIITIKGEKYAYDKIAPSTFCDIMKVAIYFQNEELSTDKLNRKGSNTDIVKTVLNGRKLLITKKKYGLVRNYVNPLETLPKELLYFFEFSNGDDSIKYVMPAELDDKKLEKILETAHKL